jgi:hypothetical protein
MLLILVQKTRFKHVLRRICRGKCVLNLKWTDVSPENFFMSWKNFYVLKSKHFWKNDRTGWKWTTPPPPPPHHFSNGPSLMDGRSVPYQLGNVKKIAICRKSWDFSGCSGFLPQEKWWVRIVKKVISQLL